MQHGTRRTHEYRARDMQDRQAVCFRFASVVHTGFESRPRITEGPGMNEGQCHEGISFTQGMNPIEALRSLIDF